MGNFEGKMKWHYFLAFFWMWVVAYSQFSSFTTATSDDYFKSDDPKMQHFMDEMLVRNPGHLKKDLLSFANGACHVQKP